MILIDYSQLVVACCLAFPEDVKKGKDTNKMMSIIRHTTLSTLLSYKEKYGKTYGQLVLCADGRNNWRKEVFPLYKHHRKGAREESSTDWKTIFDFAREFLGELKAVFPYRVVQVDRAEGDDVIAVLTKYASEYMVETNGLVEEPPKTLIISSDGDYKQLHVIKNVRQWNPIMKKMVDAPAKEFLFEKILTGDKGDGVPNVLSEDDFLVNGEGRAKSITEKVKQRFRDGTITDVEQRNFQRNKMLIDFNCIPTEVQTEIVNTFLESTPVKDLNAVMNYLMANKMRVLLNDLQKFKS